MMLEEVQMPPGHLFEIMGMAKLSADRTRITCSPLGLDGEAKLMGSFVRIKQLPRDFPWSLQPKA
jgi:hypothetical protein